MRKALSEYKWYSGTKIVYRMIEYLILKKVELSGSTLIIWSDFETGMRKIDILCFKLSYIIRLNVFTLI